MISKRQHRFVISELAQSLDALRLSLFSVYAIAFLFAFIVLFGVSANRALANSAPQISTVEDQYLNEGQTMILNISATDADGDPLALGMSSRPRGVSFTDHGDGSATCRFTADYIGPNSSAGAPFTLGFFASDGSATATEQANLTVINVNRRPVLSAPDTIYIEVGDTVAFSVSAIDPDLDPVVWTSPLLPSGARLESASGAAFANFQWAPADLDSGVSTVSFIATDFWGFSDTVTTTVFVTVGAPFTLSLSTDTAFPGELIPIEVSLKNREAITGFELVVHVDPSVMSVLSINATNSRAVDFESFVYLFNVPTPGDIRINGSTAAGQTLPAGDGPLFVMNTLVSSQVGLAGLFLPVGFVFRTGADPNDNTMTDANGAQIGVADIVYINGGTKVKEPAAINRGDINLNGVPFEVADALRFTNYFINPVQFGFTAQQFANSDVNEDGIVASVADLVSLLTIVTGAGSYRIIPGGVTAGDLQATVTKSVNKDIGLLKFNAEETIGGVYFEATTSGNSPAESIFTLSEAAKSADMTLEQSRSGDIVRVLIYGRDGNALDATTSASIEAVELVSWDNSSTQVLVIEELEVSSSSGVLLEVAYSTGNDGSVLPNSFALEQNYPNPFNPTTKIPFSLDSESDVTLIVYDLLGRTVNTLAQGRFGAGAHEVVWDGLDNSGSVVASGVYFYRLKQGERMLTRKMALLK